MGTTFTTAERLLSAFQDYFRMNQNWPPKQERAGRPSASRFGTCGAQIANIAGFMKPKQAGNLMHLKIIAHYYTLGITARITLRRRLGTNTTWYLQSHLEW